VACVESVVYLRKRGRVVECTGLENRRWATIREFESHRFRHSLLGKAASIAPIASAAFFSSSCSDCSKS
jgi:hypothetical protein